MKCWGKNTVLYFSLKLYNSWYHFFTWLTTTFLEWIYSYQILILRCQFSNIIYFPQRKTQGCCCAADRHIARIFVQRNFVLIFCSYVMLDTRIRTAHFTSFSSLRSQFGQRHSLFSIKNAKSHLWCGNLRSEGALRKLTYLNTCLVIIVVNTLL